MSNYYSMGRSNYFKFLPEPLALIEKLFAHDIQIVRKDDMAAVLAINDGIPECMIDDERTEDLLFALGMVGDDTDSVTLFDVLHLALPADETLVWIQIGNEKLRYLVGLAHRLNAQGQITETVDLNDIFKMDENRAEY